MVKFKRFVSTGAAAVALAAGLTVGSPLPADAAPIHTADTASGISCGTGAAAIGVSLFSGPVGPAAGAALGLSTISLVAGCDQYIRTEGNHTRSPAGQPSNCSMPVFRFLYRC